jgi:ubiquinone/menaquinone biosynthesis C-methylase UbiE
MKVKDLFDEREVLLSYDRTLVVAEHYDKILKIHLSNLKNCNKVLDSGCGTGILALKLLKLNKKIVGIDISSGSLELLKEKAQKIGKSKNIELFKRDGGNLGEIKGNSFDGVNSMIVAHLINNYKRYIKECYRVLKPNGIFVLTARSDNKNQDLLVNILRESLKKKGLYKNRLKDFKIISQRLLQTANSRSKNLLSVRTATEIFKEAGFKNIREKENKTKGVMYTLVAEK